MVCKYRQYLRELSNPHADHVLRDVAVHAALRDTGTLPSPLSLCGTKTFLFSHQDVPIAPYHREKGGSFAQVEGDTGPRLSLLEEFLLCSEDQHIDNLFAAFPVDILLRMRRLSSSMMYAVEAYMERKWSLKSFVAHWFPGDRTAVLSFLKVIGACDGVISGPAAETFLARRPWRDDVLHVYVPLHGLLPLGRCLRMRGYRFAPNAEQPIFFDVAALAYPSYIGTDIISRNRRPALRDRFVFRSVDNGNHGPSRGEVIEIIVTREHPVEYLVNGGAYSSMCRNLPHASVVL